MGPFSYRRFTFLFAYIDRWKVYNRLVSACSVKTAIEVKCWCVLTSQTTTLLSGFFVPHSFLLACAAINRVNLAFRTTIIEDTHLTLAVIPFKVEANNFFNFFAVTSIQEKNCRVSVPVQSLTPWYTATTCQNCVLLVLWFQSSWGYYLNFCFVRRNIHGQLRIIFSLQGS